MVIEKFKFYLKNVIFWRKPRDSFNKSNKLCDNEDSLSNSFDNKEKLYTYTLNSSTKGILTNSNTALSILPSLYLFVSLITILILLFLKYKNKITFNSDVIINNLKIPNFYDLPKIHPLFYHFYTGTTSVIGLAIVFILFSVLKQRFKVPEYQDHTFKLYIMMIFGFISNCLNLAKGFSNYIQNYDIIALKIQTDLKIDISYLLFITYIFFTVLFSIYSIRVLQLLRTKQSTENDENWYHYKVIILWYLVIFTLIYAIFILHDTNRITLNIFNNYIENHSLFVITVFPYFLHVLNAILVFSFYFELKYVNMALSQNLEVDYLFEDSERSLI